jgi:hypothetical protein
MVSMIDSMTIPGPVGAMVTIGPAVLGVLAVLIVGLAWVARQMAEELRRTAARAWERRGGAHTAPTNHGRLAA